MTERTSRPTPGQATAARRAKAIEAYGKIGVDLAAMEEVLAAIDAGGPWKRILLERVSREVGVRPPPERLLDMLAGGQFRGGGLHNVVSIAGRLPEAWIPPFPTAESSAFLDICRSLREFLRPEEHDHVPTLFANCSGAWQRWRKALLDSILLAAAADEDGEDRDEEDEDYGPRMPTLDDGIRSAFQFSLGFANQVVVPMLVREFEYEFEIAVGVGYDIARTVLTNGATLEDVLRLSKFAERRPGDFETALYDRLKPADVPTWSAIAATFRHENGLSIVPVTSAHDAIDEGRAGINPDGTRGLGNLAAGAIGHAIDRKLHLLSIRTGEEPFRRRGSIVLSYEYGSIEDARYRIESPGRKLANIRTPWPGIVLMAGLMGSGDDPLPDDAMHAFRRMAVAIAEGRLHLDVPPSPEFIASGAAYVAAKTTNEPVILHNNERVDHQTAADIAGYPVGARLAVEAAFEAWRSYLPKNLKEITFPDLQSMVSVALSDTDLIHSGRRQITP